MATHKVLTTAPEDASALALALSEKRLLVVSLCAAWCDTCTEFRSVFERIAAARPEHGFVWLDVEDDAELVGDIDVENFPTLAIYRKGLPLHFGVSLPLESVVTRLMDTISTAPNPQSSSHHPDGVVQLPAQLQQLMSSSMSR